MIGIRGTTDNLFSNEKRTNEKQKKPNIVKENVLKWMLCIWIFKGLIYNSEKPNTDGSILRDPELKKQQQQNPSNYPGKNKQVKGKTTKEKPLGNIFLFNIIY